VVAVVDDRQQKSFFKNKKTHNPDPSPPGLDPCVEEEATVSHAERWEVVVAVEQKKHRC
jgi:hypothetical protein